MKLNEFVQQTIEEIITGVESANKTIKQKGAEIATGQMQFSGATGKVARSTTTSETVHFIEFDVSVVAENNEEGSGGAGLVVGPIAIGAKTQNHQKDANINRISFSIPLLLPNKKKIKDITSGSTCTG